MRFTPAIFLSHIFLSPFFAISGTADDRPNVLFIIAAPGTTQPKTKTSCPVGLIDLFPTLNELCSPPDTGQLDGFSLVPLLQDPNFEWKRLALTIHGQGNHA